jgi:hypothetical protein
MRRRRSEPAWKREVRAALKAPLPTLTPPVPYDDPDVIRGEREAIARARWTSMSVCEQAGYHVFTFGKAACRCGKEQAPGG